MSFFHKPELSKAQDSQPLEKLTGENAGGPERRVEVAERPEGRMEAAPGRAAEPRDVWTPAEERPELPRMECQEGGGSYDSCKEYIKTENLENREIHHVPADSVTELKTGDGPCIVMEKQDHMQTASWGSSRDAREYRAEQAALVQEGKFREAMEMDISDLKSKFDGKYDTQIAEMRRYADALEKGGFI